MLNKLALALVTPHAQRYPLLSYLKADRKRKLDKVSHTDGSHSGGEHSTKEPKLEKKGRSLCLAAQQLPL